MQGATARTHLLSLLTKLKATSGVICQDYLSVCFVEFTGKNRPSLIVNLLFYIMTNKHFR